MRPSISLAIAAALLASCSSVPKRGPEPAPSPAPPSVELVQAGHLARYAAALHTVVQGNATARAEQMNSARDSYADAKAGPAALLYGLLLAAPGNPDRDAKLALRVLQEALAQDELLTSAEKDLGKVEIARLDAELRQQAEIDRLVAELQQVRQQQSTTTTNTAALNRRLQTELEDSARLRKALDEARAKLDAITRMERNTPPAPEGRNQ